MAGFGEEDLTSGRVLVFESGAVVRITHACEICSALRKFVDAATYRALVGERGALGVVVRDGAILRGGRVVLDDHARFPVVPDAMASRAAWVLGQVPAGNVLTYDILLRLIGGKRAYVRALPAYVKRAEAAGLPGHRVLTSRGTLTGHVAYQKERLAREGTSVDDSERIIDRYRAWFGRDLYTTPISDIGMSAALDAPILPGRVSRHNVEIALT
ncbi:MGMT family protein [Solirubrobacter phytolaccae]|uniref:MGMT family protein n=1 Tax=Solirubrobacter phytolaccae TaxID=1404360 RepID=A0A9X3N6F6_9ACTN|nr:MGMT family protein [Solirubrobacter phytolaccae]MDA0179154.1 MGMT family protein [Solirubrobacter phytolaccae]